MNQNPVHRKENNKSKIRIKYHLPPKNNFIISYRTLQERKRVFSCGAAVSNSGTALTFPAHTLKVQTVLQEVDCLTGNVG